MLLVASSSIECSTPHLDANVLFESSTFSLDAGNLDLYSLGSRIREVRIGSTRYRFRNEGSGYPYPTASGFEYVVNLFQRRLVGKGVTPGKARRDWEEILHCAFQRLIRTRPFEMSEADAALWKLLEARIDVPEYRRTTPIVMRQVGNVDYRHTDRPREIRWADGTRNRIDLDQVPSRFAGLHPNQWFEAVVQRDPVNGSLLGILAVEPIPPLRPMNMKEQREFFSSLPVGTCSADNQDDIDG